MTYWQLAGISFAWKSYQKHGFVDPAIVLCALSQVGCLFCAPTPMVLCLTVVRTCIC